MLKERVNYFFFDWKQRENTFKSHENSGRIFETYQKLRVKYIFHDSQ